jgi:DNA repair protein RecN (Recombination protein N)
MLAELVVSDLGVIHGLSLVLDPGMTALTGETGAGKTMIVGAIGLLAGGRADASIVRPGAKEAVIEGRFVVGDDEHVLTRVVPRDGRSRSYRDGRPLSAADLAEHAAALVDLHGQHAHVGLLTTASQRRALDRWAGVDLAPLEAARAARRAAEAALAALGGDADARARELDVLRHQLAEIEAAAVTGPDEDDRLAAEEDLLAGADAHREAAAAADAALGTDRGARDLVGQAIRHLTDRPPFADLAARLAAALTELDDLARELRDRADAIDADPAHLALIQERRALLADLRRRYSGGARRPLEDLLAVRDDLSERVQQLSSHEQRAAAAEAALEEATGAEAAAAAVVGHRRRAGAPALAAAVQERLADLGLPRAAVAIEVGATDPGDDVTFLLSLNPGLPPAPLAKAASGGELARTMLALRLVVGARVPTLVFDEVDAGVGGAAARAVGRALAALAEDKQVLVVTHLPQVAAFADAQIGISKDDDGATTVVRAQPLAPRARVQELARMLSGLAESESGQEHAEELLATAVQERGR